MGSWSILSSSPRQTKGWGKRVGKLLEGGEIIGLIGELGTGKTSFVRGLAEGLGVGSEAWIRSPTFTLINEYHGRLPLYHVDLYRLGDRHEMEGLGLRDYLYSDGASVIEWFDHLPAGEVEEYIEIKLQYADGDGNGRQLTFTAHGERYEKLLEEFKSSRVQGFNRSTNFQARRSKP
jgi:tRNA threonylcarbamoyladenosine biosynthesis protein TsaE